MPQMRVLAVCGSVLLVPVFFARGAAATEPVQDIGVLPPSQPPPQGQPPPQYPQYQQVPTNPQQQYPQQQYPQQQYPQYQPMPAPYRSVRASWRDGDPVPPGYHVEDKPRSGLVTGGLIMVLVPYSIGAFATISAKFGNESTWLLAPVIGPWMTMGQRRYYDCPRSGGGDTLGCAADVFVVMGLIVSGVVQAAGATLLLVGILNTKPGLVHDEASLRVRPMTIGSGYGLGLSSGF